MDVVPVKSLVYVLVGTGVEAITTDLNQFFQKARIWPYKAINATTGAPTANAATINVGQTGVAVSRTLTNLIVAGGVATATFAAHGFRSGQYVTISGATPSGLNGTFEIYEAATDTFKFRVAGSIADGPATGTITAAVSPALPWAIANTVTTPLEIILPLGMKRRVADIVARGTATDGVYVEWE